MPGIISQGPLSPSQVTAPGVYVQILPPPSAVAGVVSNAGALAGSATWGPVNMPVLTGAPTDVLRNFAGPANGVGSPAASLDATANPFDLASAAFLAYAQAGAGGAFQLYCLRAIDGEPGGFQITSAASMPVSGMFAQAYQIDNVLDATHNPAITHNTSAAFAYLVLVDTAGSPITGGTLITKYYGTTGNGVSCVVAAASIGSGVNVTLTPPGGLGLNQEVFPNLPNTAGFWVALQNALANGINGVRGPSLLCQLVLPHQTASGAGFTAGTDSTHAPALISSTPLAHGADGTATLGTYATAYSLASNLLGSASATPTTGLYTLQGLNPPVSGFTVAGFGDNLYGDYALLETGVLTGGTGLADSMAAFFASGLAVGDDANTGQAVTDIGTIGITDFEQIYVKDHVFFNDGVHGTRLMNPAAGAVGARCALPPQNSCLNTTFKGTSGTSRTALQGTPAPYSNAEIGLCNTNGILLITQPIPGANALGFATGVNASISVSPITGGIEYTTLTNFLAKSLSGAFGGFIGKNQGPLDPDPTRQGVFSALSQFLQLQLDGGTIAAFSVQCDAANNPPASIALHFLNAAVRVEYFSSVWYFLLSFTGGSNVNVSIQQGSQA